MRGERPDDSKEMMMPRMIRSTFLRRFAGGFALGAALLCAVQPATIGANLGIVAAAEQSLG